MGTLWVWVGVAVACIGLAIVLFVVAVKRHKGRVFSILGGAVLIVAAFILLACYLPVFVVPDVIANSAVLDKPAPVDASATIYYLSPTVEATGTPHVTAVPLIAVAARTGAIRW